VDNLRKNISNIGMSKKYDFALVDAFTIEPLSGNPCSIVVGADGFSSKKMLAIAKEMNQSETAFLMTSSTSDLKARYFTPAEEIPLAGHPTIASIHLALELGLIDKNKDSISLELNEGPIKIGIQKDGNRNLISMFQRKPIFAEVHNPSEVLHLFNLQESDLLPNSVIQTVSTGTRQMFVPLKDHESLRKVKLDNDGYAAYQKKKNIFGPHFFVLNGITAEGDTFARHLSAPPDTPEDAFTGSATGGMAAYLWKYNLIKKNKFIAEQGHWMGRPGKAQVEIFGSSDNIETVCISGTATTVINGKLNL